MAVIKPEGDWIAQVATVITAGDVICLPTDTVYGIGADPFNDSAITNLLTAKFRTRQKPPPVLVSGIDQATRLVSWFPSVAARLAEAFWPGALTIILPARENIGWDLGETNGTVALRMPNDLVALDLLRELGPLAVTSANKTGEAPANTAHEARSQLGDSVRLYIDAGRTGGGVPSTIVRLSRVYDAGGASEPGSSASEPIGTAGKPARIELIRDGAISVAELEKAAGSVVR